MNYGSIIPRPPDEVKRLAALRRYAMLDTPIDDNFDFLTELAATLCGTPFAFIALVDEDRVWYKSAYGSLAREIPRDYDYCSLAILEDHDLNIPDLHADTRTARLPLTRGPLHYRMYHGVNLLSSDGYHIGTLCVLDVKVRELSLEQCGFLSKLARQVMFLFELRAKDIALRDLNEKVKKVVIYDELTGLSNRRALLARLQAEMDRSRRIGTELSIVMIALDNFKTINERHGRDLGDIVLRGVATLLREHIRVTDIAGRYGGDQLCVLLPGTSVTDAVFVGNTLRTAIANAVFAGMGHQVKVTASIGAVLYHVQNTPTVESLIELASLAMFRAKVAGRNRVETAEGSP
ncbi:MAG: GGDEF domain-containing protein [Pseudomonadota bacterium]